MKKSLALLLLVLFRSTPTCCLSQQGPDDDVDDDSSAMVQGWPWFPYRSPHFTRPHVDCNIKKCIKAYEAGRPCIYEIYVSFWAPIGDECCKLVKEVDKDCTHTIFARFKGPFFQLLVKEHCGHRDCLAANNNNNGSGGGGAPSPAPSRRQEEDPVFY